MEHVIVVKLSRTSSFQHQHTNMSIGFYHVLYLLVLLYTLAMFYSVSIYCCMITGSFVVIPALILYVAYIERWMPNTQFFQSNFSLFCKFGSSLTVQIPMMMRR